MNRIRIKEAVSILSAAMDRRVMITFHSMGDTDSVASAVALAGMLNDGTVSMPDSITRNAVTMLEKLGYDPKFSKAFRDDAELIILVDVNNFEGCGAFEEKLKGHKRDILIIDHHAPEDIPSNNVYSFDDEGYNSTSSMVYEISKEIGADTPQNEAKLLALGIISDSAEFKNATYQTFYQLAELFEQADTSYIKLQEEFHNAPFPEHRLGILTDLCHSESKIVKGRLFIYGKARGHASDVADMAINVGADAAVFYSENTEEAAVSARLKPTLDEKYSMHLGVIMKDVSRMIGGTGGGHPCAAGAYGPTKENVEGLVIELIKRISNKMAGENEQGVKA